MQIEIIKILFLTTIAFLISLALTPCFSNFLYKNQFYKKIRTSKDTPIFSKLHSSKKNTPTMGGILIWVTVLIVSGVFLLASKLFPESFLAYLNFINREETYLPLGALFASALVGLVDDLWEIYGLGQDNKGLRVKDRVILYTLIAAFGAWWFYFKLQWTSIYIPFMGNYDIGILYILVFIFIIVATSFSVNLTDGLDGLAGGVLLFALTSYGSIAFIQHKYNLATLCGVLVGALLAFLWFNIHPARFFMGDTGSMSLGVTLGIISILTNAVLLLPIIGLVLVAESVSVIMQTASKKLFNTKIFPSTPIHHTLEFKGWGEPRIVMRLWIISAISSMAGLIIFLVDRMS